MPRRLSGNRSKQPRNDPSRESSGRTQTPNRIPGFLRIPDLHPERRFTSTVAFQTHRPGRDRDSLAFRTAAACHPPLPPRVANDIIRQTVTQPECHPGNAAPAPRGKRRRPTSIPNQKGPLVTQAWLNRIGTAVPPNDIHSAFIEFGRDTIVDAHKRALFDRMAALADIDHRYAILEAAPRPRETILDTGGIYRRGASPSTAARMALYEPHALHLALRAIRRLDAD